MVEAADTTNAGLVYGFLTTAHNLGLALATPVSNQVFTFFHPSLSDAANYIADTPRFRATVAKSYLLTYVFTILSFVALPLLPSQKAEAQRRKATWPSSLAFGAGSVLLLIASFAYAATLTVLAVWPATACSRLVGGSGCTATG